MKYELIQLSNHSICIVEALKCILYVHSDRRPDTGHGGSTVGGTGGGHTTSAGSGIQPAGGGSLFTFIKYE